MNYQINHCGILILAAGQSARLGIPKQLLDYEGLSLIKRVAQTALESGIGKVTVVLGANAEQIRTELDMPALCLVENRGWEEGMASSVRAGVRAITAMDRDTDGLMILVCDQPYLGKTVLQQLIQLQRESGLPLAACVYDGKAGTPALFHKTVFPELLELTGDTGARKLINSYGDQVAQLTFEEGKIDIDTKEDYEKLTRNK
jgi:molybdenum cofactor cytidylyltransferase